MTDDGKLTEPICFKTSERMALDLLRAATREDRSVSDFVRSVMRRELYGRLAADGEQSSSAKV